MSLRSHLLLRLIIVSILLVGGASWLGYEDVRHETRELFDAQLARSARLLLSMAQAQYGEASFSQIQQYLDENGLSVMYLDFEEKDEDQSTENGHIYETKLAFQIWDNAGNLVVKSYNAPLEPMATIDKGYNDIVIDNFNWRTFSLLSSNQQYRCITAERIDVRNDLIVKISNDLFYMFIILIPALSLILYISINKGLKPLQRLADQIDYRSGDNLDLIISDHKYTEIVTIKNALNQLLRRLNETLSREKRITSDAAHELRTPLAAIRLHTELAKSATNLDQQNESLDLVIQGVDRTTHLVEQLLNLARLESESLGDNFADFNLTALISEECALLSPLATNKNISIMFNGKQIETINGHETSLRLLVRNLLTNAIAYTPQQGEIKILLLKKDQQISIIIEDNGPGISEDDRKRVMERFYRVENHQTPGCGIGLSIVERVVQIHKGSLMLGQVDGGPGLKVTIQLPI